MDGNRKTEYQEMGALRWLLMELRQQCFQNSTHTMAFSLDVRESEVIRAITNEGARSGITVFEQSVKYCIRHGISIDELMRKYPDKMPAIDQC